MTRFVVGFFATVLAVVLVLVVWLAITGWGAKKASDGIRAEAALATTEVSDGQVVSAMARMPAVADHARTLDSTLNSVPWSLLTDLPVIGETVSALASISQATSRTLDAASLPEMDDTESTQRVGLRLLEQSADSLDEMADIATFEADYVRAINSSQVLSALRAQIEVAQAEYLSLANGLNVASGAANALPTVLGYQGARTWLVILQNTSEARGTGGLVGAYSIGKVKNGRFHSSVSDSNNSLSGQKISTRAIPWETRKLWGDDLAYIWGLNLDRHYPFAAQLLPQTLPVGSPAIDDVVSLDPAAVAALLKLTGPVTSHGVTVTGATAEEFFTETVYTQFPDVKEKDAVVVDMLETTLGKLSEEAFDLAQLWTVIGPMAGEERVLIASNDAEVQAQLARMPTAGVVPKDPDPWATVAVNDFAGSKMSAFVKVDVRYESASLCSVEGGKSKLTVTATNNAPKIRAAYADIRNDIGTTGDGSTKVNLAMYAPVGAELKSVIVDGNAEDAELGWSREHPVWKRSVELKRGKTRTVEVTFDEPYWPNVTPVMKPQPMVQDMTVTVAKPASCS